MLLQAQLAQTLGGEAGVAAVTEIDRGVDKISLFDMACKGGWIMLILAALFILAIYIFCERLRAFRKVSKDDEGFLERISDFIRSDDVHAAQSYCNAVNTPLSAIVQRGIALMDRSRNEMQTGMENAANIEIAKLEKGLSAMSTIASAAPMIGFLGTVLGMVQAFWQMANAGNNIDVSLLSSGIYEAMITTVGGLIVGIAALFAYNFLVARMDSMTNSMESVIMEFTESAESLKNQ